MLGPEFGSGWVRRRIRKFKTLRTESLKQKVHVLAKELFENYFEPVQSQPRSVMMKLENLSKQLRLFAARFFQPKETEEVLRETLLDLRDLLQDEHSLSTFEIFSSDLVPALLQALPVIGSRPAWMSIFAEIFGEESAAWPVSPAVLLVRKIVAVLESVEKLPHYFYETPGSSFGLQLLNRRFRLKLQRASASEIGLVDLTGRRLKMEPLATVGQLKQYLSKMVAKQWYDFERSSFAFFQYLKHHGEITLEYSNDFDQNGILYWIGTNGKTVGEWVNPGKHSIVRIMSSEGMDKS